MAARSIASLQWAGCCGRERSAFSCCKLTV